MFSLASAMKTLDFIPPSFTLIQYTPRLHALLFLTHLPNLDPLFPLSHDGCQMQAAVKSLKALALHPTSFSCLTPQISFGSHLHCFCESRRDGSTRLCGMHRWTQLTRPYIISVDRGYFFELSLYLLRCIMPKQT
jgi:hypothetical protein